MYVYYLVLLKTRCGLTVGRLGLLDYDEVELSNLHRQVLHSELTQGRPKSQSAAQAIKRYLRPFVVKW